MVARELERVLEQPDRLLELRGEAIGAGQRIHDPGIAREPVAEQPAALLQALDRLVEPAGVQVDLAEPAERAPAVDAIGRSLEGLGVQVLGELELIEPQRNVGLDEAVGLVHARGAVAR